MNQTAKEFKETFYKTVEKYKLPLQNKSIFYYTLADRLQEESENPELRQLLITSICDNGYLLNQFSVSKIGEEATGDYRQIQQKITKYNHAYKSVP